MDTRSLKKSTSKGQKCFYLIQMRDGSYKIFDNPKQYTSSHGAFILSHANKSILEQTASQLSKTEQWKVIINKSDTKGIDEKSECYLDSENGSRNTDYDDFYSTFDDEDYHTTTYSSSSSTPERTIKATTAKKRLFSGTEGESSITSMQAASDKLTIESSSHYTPEVVISKTPHSLTVTAEQLSTESSSRGTTEKIISATPTSSVAPPSPFRSTVGSYFQINLDKSWVTMTVAVVLHAGTYECNVVKEDNKLMGFLAPIIPDRNHECVSADSGLDRTYVVISRNLNELRVKVRVAFCTPIGKLEGDEINFSDENIARAPLKVRGDIPTASAVPNKNKKHCCVYCQKLFTEITAHLCRMHKDEEEIKTILTLEKNSAQRNSLRLKVDDLFNKSVSLENRIPLRRFDKPDSGVKCPQCLGILAPLNYARHERRCTGRLPDRRGVLKPAKLHQLKTGEGLQGEVIKQLTHHLRLDVIQHEISSDKALKLVTEKYAFMHRGAPAALKNDRQHLRRLGRLLLIIKEKDPSITDFEDLITYGSYELLLQAIHTMCNIDNKTGTIKKPSLAKVLRSLITFLLDTLKTHYIEQNYSNDSLELNALMRFYALHESNYGVYIGRAAHRATLVNKAMKPNILPSSRDVKLFSQYVMKESEIAFQNLQQGFSYDEWLRLGKSELIKTILFNRRRVTEVASMLVELYQQKKAVDNDKKSTLTFLQRSLADNYKIMTIIGKREHILHVLLDNTQCRHLDLFLAYRETAGVDAQNRYLFGVPTTTVYIDASSALREMSAQCGAEKPHLLRTTYLRKQVATLSQLLTMNDNQIGQVAKLMGHSQKVHEQVYRQDEHLFQVTVWAKFLNIINDEDLNKYKGKTLDEIVNVADQMELHDDPTEEDHIIIDELVDSNPITQEGDEIQNLQLAIDVPSCSTSAPEFSTQEVRLTPTKRISTKTKPISPTKSPTIAQILQKLSPAKCKKRTRTSFSSREISIINQHLTEYITQGRPAPLTLCDELVAKYKNVFYNRSGRVIYNYVQNLSKKVNKK